MPKKTRKELMPQLRRMKVYRILLPLLRGGMYGFMIEWEDSKKIVQAVIDGGEEVDLEHNEWVRLEYLGVVSPRTMSRVTSMTQGRCPRCKQFLKQVE